jgi:hypothetical protein
MSFEEQLTRAFETLSDRLRGEIDEQVRRTAAELIAAAHADRQAAAETPSDDAASARLTDALQALDRARSLTELLDTLVTQARAEASSADVWLLRDGRLHPWRSMGSDAAVDEPAPPIEKGIPLTVGGATVAYLFVEPRTTNAEPRTTNVEARTTNVDLLARYASRCLEAMTAFKTARALALPDHEIPDTEEAAQADSDQRSEEETSARRYARLLVSEIRLYHESAVIDGRRDRDLTARLGGEIARARVLYEQRVPPHVRGRADYFHDELVQTLANGDSSLLEVRS